MLDGTELEILKWARGPMYRRRRDAALAGTADLGAILEGSRRQPDRRIEVIATILDGWRRHGADYQAFFTEIGEVNVASVSKTVTGLGGAMTSLARAAQSTYGEAILPLCWEQILKFSDELPDWHLETMFLTIGQIPSDASIEPLLWFVELTSDAGQIDAAHQALLKLPYEGWRDRLREMKQALSLRTFVADDLLARIKAAKKA